MDAKQLARGYSAEPSFNPRARDGREVTEHHVSIFLRLFQSTRP